MGTYITANTIRMLREQQGLTQLQLAARIGVTDKAISKWESGRGLPDISLIEDLACALGISVGELLTGEVRTNTNRAGNMMRSCFYTCPICGNILHATGEASLSCCGVELSPLEAEAPDKHHNISVAYRDGSWQVSSEHPMTKKHFISWVAYVTSGALTLVKLYPEQDMEVSISARGSGKLLVYCNRDGLFELKTPPIHRKSADL